MSSDRDWRDSALCAQVDPSLFVPTHMGDQQVEARKLCRQCPAREACLQDALRLKDIFGFRGGMSGEARRLMIAKANKVGAKDAAEVDSGEVLRLHGKRWTSRAIATRLGVDHHKVYRVIKAHREAAA